MIPTLTALIGPPGAGKSTAAASYAAQTGAVVLSLDQLRAACSPHGDEADQAATPDAVRALHTAITEHLAARRSVLVDSTNAVRAHRLALLDLARPFRALSAALVLCPPLRVCLDRNDQRDASPGECGFPRRVPPETITLMHDQITRDLPTLHTEGWDRITMLEDAAR